MSTIKPEATAHRQLADHPAPPAVESRLDHRRRADPQHRRAEASGERQSVGALAQGVETSSSISHASGVERDHDTGGSLLERFPNLSSPLFDRIRIPARGPVKRIAEQMCAEAGMDPDLVRNIYLSRKSTPPELVPLRCRIMVALRAAGFTVTDAQAQWFVGFKLRTLEDYLVEGKKLQEAEDA